MADPDLIRKNIAKTRETPESEAELVRRLAGDDDGSGDAADAPTLLGDPAAAPESTVVGSAEPLAISVGDSRPVPGAGLSSAGGKARIGDRVLAFLTTGAASIVIGIVLLVGVFLVVKSVPSIMDDKVNFLTSSEWDTTPGALRFGIAPILYTTLLISFFALAIALPLSIGIALFITHYAPARIAKPVAYVIDLLAAIPSIIYGIWGIRELAPKLQPVADGLSHIGLGLFSNENVNQGTVFTGGIVLAIMILPITTAIARDVFARTPRANIEAALALGATKWEMIRMAVLPYGRSGLVSGAMLGLGRALGETVAIFLIVSSVSDFSFSLFSGGDTFASKIAKGSNEFNNPASTGAYIAAGLVLFVLTFVVNAAARAVVNRKKDFV